MSNQSKIESLIQDLCPNGVEFSLLADLEDTGSIKLGRGKVISKIDILENPGNYPVYSSSAVGDGEIGRYGEYMFDDERLSWSIDGGGKFFHRTADKYSITNVSGWLKILDESKLNLRYLYYAITNEWATKVFDYTHKAHPSVIRNEYKIPVPPLAVQEEIVRILDSFTELEAELEARKKQYEFYREELLTFGDDVEQKKIEEICLISRGRVMSKDYLKDNAGKYPVYSSQTVNYGIFGNIDTYDYDGEYITWTTDGAHVGSIFYRKGKFSITNVCGLLKVKDDNVNIKFLSYILATVSKKYVSSGMGNPKIMSNVMSKIKIPVPSLAEQERIVSILDKFDALVSSTSSETEGIPAELKARRQQYEYYRNKLLTFQEIKNEDN